MGYAEAKHIAERMLASASSSRMIPASICRAGQIPGPMREGSSGVWNRSEWLPSLLVSSAHIGILLESLGTVEEVDWLPVDGLVDVLVEMAVGARDRDE